MLLEGDDLRELRLVVRAVEAHFELREVLRVFFDVVHGAEGGLASIEAGGLVIFACNRWCCKIFPIEVFVVLGHVGAVRVGDGDVVGELGTSE